ncbi:DUF4145 domain-containing protein [Candidatus Shapirobacteria bacterium]|nr:DUF4145 domain-containing protein [Candidatus Shapirobacteria bacterium]
MKCPYHDCQKDFNPEWGTDVAHVHPTKFSDDGDGLWIETAECKFCNRQFHQIFRSRKQEVDGEQYPRTFRKELLFTFPSVRTTFVSKTLPLKIKEYFNEAERCRSIGSITGAGACLRKTVYAICDDKGVIGKDYREKIVNLDVKGKYQELLTQIKWLGDNTTKPGDEKYTLNDIDLGLEILPLLIEEMYLKDEKIDAVDKILSKVRSRKL